MDNKQFTLLFSGLKVGAASERLFDKLHKTR
jgi:hypothetical protein